MPSSEIERVTWWRVGRVGSWTRKGVVMVFRLAWSLDLEVWFWVWDGRLLLELVGRGGGTGVAGCM